MGPNLLTSYEPKALDPTASFTIITHSFIPPAQGLPAASSSGYCAPATGLNTGKVEENQTL